MSEFSSPGGNGETRGECSDKDAPVADRRAHVFAKGGEFVDQLLALKRSTVDPVGTGLLRPNSLLSREVQGISSNSGATWLDTAALTN